MKKETFLELTKNKLIVSCQALSHEPMHGSSHMVKMSLAAEEGGAVAIRANSVNDINAIKDNLDLPVIGLIKQVYDDSDIFITPTKKEATELINTKAEVIALDATNRRRPNNEELKDLIEYIHKNNRLVLADISTFEEGVQAKELGVDFISTTLSGYTSYTQNDNESPDFKLVKKLVENLDSPIIAEGRISSPEEAVKLLEIGAHTVIVGSAITRPQLITKKFVEAINNSNF